MFCTFIVVKGRNFHFTSAFRKVLKSQDLSVSTTLNSRGHASSVLLL